MRPRIGPQRLCRAERTDGGRDVVVPGTGVGVVFVVVEGEIRPQRQPRLRPEQRDAVDLAAGRGDVFLEPPAQPAEESRAAVPSDGCGSPGPCGPARSSPTGRDARLPARRHRETGRGRPHRGRSHRSASRRAVLRRERRSVRGCCASRRTGGTGIRRCSSSRTTAPARPRCSRFTAVDQRVLGIDVVVDAVDRGHQPRARPEARDGRAAAPRRSPRPDGGAAWFPPRPRLRPG